MLPLVFFVPRPTATLYGIPGGGGGVAGGGGELSELSPLTWLKNFFQIFKTQKKFEIIFNLNLSIICIYFLLISLLLFNKQLFALSLSLFKIQI